jgi:diaminohydroxyphosphoribosylaminopyrimidine deaminase / 5-amino-6-(5-phosphoribosylamino)uracil reductase
MTDIELMELAFAESERCPPSPTAYSVGAVLTTPNREIIVTGYSRETGEQDHAEEAAFKKANGKDLQGAWLYVTLEPCGMRKSKPKSCSELTIDHRIARVIYATAEPPFFVAQQSGLQRLATASIQLVHLKGFEGRFEQLHPHLYKA